MLAGDGEARGRVLSTFEAQKWEGDSNAAMLYIFYLLILTFYLLLLLSQEEEEE